MKYNILRADQIYNTELVDYFSVGWFPLRTLYTQQDTYLQVYKLWFGEISIYILPFCYMDALFAEAYQVNMLASLIRSGNQADDNLCRLIRSPYQIARKES